MTATLPTTGTLEAPALAAAPPKHRIAELDAMRGIAAVAVMLFHYTWREGSQGAWVRLEWGRFGVQLFFMISGYVILMTVRRVKSAREFAVSRFARLYPAFWVACGLTYTAVALWMPEKRVTAWEAWANLLMVQIRHMRTIDGVYWTLHQEMFFYMTMFGLLAAGGLSFWRRRGVSLTDYAPWVVACVVVTSLCTLRITQWFSLFLIGMVMFDSRERFRWTHAVLLALAAADIISRSQWTKNPEVAGWRYDVATLVCGLIVLAATRLHLPWLTNPVLLFLGKVSYTVYLLHAMIGYIIIDWMRGAGVEINAAIGIAVAGSLALASAVTFGIERPVGKVIRKWGRDWEARRAGVEPVSL